MQATFDQISRDVLRVSPAERAELADFLVESIDSTAPDGLQRLWFVEAMHRLADVRSGAVGTIPGDEYLAEARRLVGR